MPAIFVDADACPVKEEAIKVAARHGLKLYIVSNGGIRPSREPHVETVIVPEGADAADDWIAGRIAAFDIAVTADIPLADRCLKQGALVIAPDGRRFDAASIGAALAGRELSRHLRELAPGGQTRHAGFGPKDRSRFLSELEVAVQAAKRATP